MRVNKKEAKLLEEAIEHWQEEGVIDAATGTQLKKSISASRYEFDSLAFYASIAAVSCAILAFGALVLDEKWIERMRKFFQFSEFLIGFLFAGVSVLLVWIAQKRKQKFAYATLANESFTILVALSIGVSVAYFSRSFGVNEYSYGLAIFAAAVLYGAAAVYLNSKLLWICMLLALISSWGAQTYAWSGDTTKSYFLGMNYPLRMTIFGLLLLTVIHLLQHNKTIAPFYNLSRYLCWTFLFLSALILSVSGNWSYDVWAAIKQGRLFMWAIGYTVLLAGLLVYALREKDEPLRDIIIIFFLLDLYTRYFEYFWDRTNKGIFFGILALSFWFISKQLEKLKALKL